MENTEKEKRIRQARTEYYREYRKTHKEQIKQYNKNYWLKKSLKDNAQDQDER